MAPGAQVAALTADAVAIALLIGNYFNHPLFAQYAPIAPVLLAFGIVGSLASLGLYRHPAALLIIAFVLVVGLVGIMDLDWIPGLPV